MAIRAQGYSVTPDARASAQSYKKLDSNKVMKFVLTAGILGGLAAFAIAGVCLHPGITGHSFNFLPHDQLASFFISAAIGGILPIAIVGGAAIIGSAISKDDSRSKLKTVAKILLVTSLVGLAGWGIVGSLMNGYAFHSGLLTAATTAGVSTISILTILRYGKKIEEKMHEIFDSDEDSQINPYFRQVTVTSDPIESSLCYLEGSRERSVKEYKKIFSRKDGEFHIGKNGNTYTCESKDQNGIFIFKLIEEASPAAPVAAATVPALAAPAAVVAPIIGSSRRSTVTSTTAEAQGSSGVGRGNNSNLRRRKPKQD